MEVLAEGNRLLDALGDDSLRRAARLKLEGYTNEEIAQVVGCSVATVERKLAFIRAELSTKSDEGFGL